MKSALGKNEIGKFMSKATQNAGINRPSKKLTNHSVRKTSISRLLDANTPENYVAQLSGHKKLESLQSYKTASEEHQRQMSLILSKEATSFSNREPTASALCSVANLSNPSKVENGRATNTASTSGLTPSTAQLKGFEGSIISH